jgi:NTE family protein
LYGRALRWVWALLRGGLGHHNPRALLDYQPLRELLERHLDFARIDMQLRRGMLEGVAITASGYGSGRAVTFYQSASQVPAWSRERAQSRATRLSLDHVMASIAIPLLFEAVQIGDDWYGDGSMRDHTPLSPAINLGARRLLVITTRNSDPVFLPQPPPYPQLGKIAGYVLDSLFMDSTGSNLERVQRLNELARRASSDALAPHSQPWRQIDTCVVRPSQDLRHLATLHAHRFPAPVLRLFRGIGAFGDLSPLPSYLLFDGTFCQALMDLGHADAQRQKDEIMALLVPG